MSAHRVFFATAKGGAGFIALWSPVAPVWRADWIEPVYAKAPRRCFTPEIAAHHAADFLYPGDALELVTLPAKFAAAAKRVASGFEPWPTTAAERDAEARRIQEEMRRLKEEEIRCKFGGNEAAYDEAKRIEFEAEYRRYLRTLGGDSARCFITLGLRPDADANAVKAAFRELAKTTHPDVKGGSPGRFRAIKRAYDLCLDLCEDAAKQAVPGGTAATASGPTPLMGDGE